MKLKMIFLMLLAGLCTMGKAMAQEAVRVDRSLTGIQAGFLGIWVHNESRIADKMALRAEVGFDAGLFGGAFHDQTGFILAPVLNLEPRWYYNLAKRLEKGKTTAANSANFLALKISYLPDWFVISKTPGVGVPEQISFIPKWAIKRTIANHFTYEAGIGLGYRYYLPKQGYITNYDGEAALDLHLRIGYTL